MLDFYVLHWNEEKITQFIMNYWKLLPIRKIFIVDNQSTDNSLNLIKTEFKDKVQIVQYNTNNQIDDITYMYIKNNIWKEFSRNKVDFVWVSDFDEVLYIPNLINELEYMKNNNKDILYTNDIDLFTQKFPTDKSKLLHELDDVKFINMADNNICKAHLFNPNTIEDMKFSVGQHFHYPIRFDRSEVTYHYCKAIQFHCKNLSLDYLINRNKLLETRLSDVNKRYKLGIHYTFSIEKITNDFQEHYENAANDLDELFNKLK